MSGNQGGNIPCQCCKSLFPVDYIWYVCTTCGYRTCAGCMQQKCPECPYGMMQQKQ